MSRRRNNFSNNQICFLLISLHFCLTTKSVGWASRKCRTKTNQNHPIACLKKVLSSANLAFWLRVTTWRKIHVRMIKVCILLRNPKKSHQECRRNLQIMTSLKKFLTQTVLSFSYIKFKSLESVLLWYPQKKMRKEKKTIPLAHRLQANNTLKITAIHLPTRTTPNHKTTMQGLNSLRKVLSWLNAHKMASGHTKK